jgi:ABC-2 type transport system ATP-binding protein
MPVIETDELSKSFGETHAVDRVSMSVNRGEVFGFLGPNGAGKTTTVRLLLGLLRPSGGSATVFGLDTETESVGIRSRLGNLPGDYSYDPRMTGREVVCFFAELRGLRDIGRAEALA